MPRLYIYWHLASGSGLLLLLLLLTAACCHAGGWPESSLPEWPSNLSSPGLLPEHLDELRDRSQLGQNIVRERGMGADDIKRVLERVAVCVRESEENHPTVNL
jgi:hypothetical protein